MTVQEILALDRRTLRWAIVCAGTLGVVLCLALGALVAAMRYHSSLHRAVAEGDVRRVEQILDKHPAWLERRNKLERTPLHEATWDDRAEVVDVLIRRGANVNAKLDLVRFGDGQWTALHLAAGAGRTASARLLIRGGAEINTRSLAGETPLDIAVDRGKWELAELLRAHGGVRGKDL